MVAPGGPACQRCGTPLRWIAQMNAWGCDRCQVTYPAQPVAPPAPMQPPPMQMQQPMQPPQPPPQPQGYGGYPQPGYAPQQGYAQPGYAPQPGYAAAPAAANPAAAAQKKKILLFAGIGVAALAVVVILVVVLGGGGGGGKSSPKELYESAATLAASGDIDGLAPLMAESRFSKVMDCSGAKGGGDYGGAPSQDKVMAQIRKDLTHDVKDWKGLTVTVSSVDEKGDAETKKAGDDDGGCKFKTDVTSQKFKVKVKAKGPDGEAESETTLRAMKIDGKWYLEELPDPPDASDMKAEFKKFTDQMCACKDTTCAQKVSDGFTAWGTKMGDKYKDKKPSEEEMKFVEDQMKTFSDCQMKAMSGGN
jgi:hypothetical protein